MGEIKSERYIDVALRELESELRRHMDELFTTAVKVWDGGWVRTEITKHADGRYEMRVIGELSPRDTTAAHLIEDLPMFKEGRDG
jgi:hypothetical protein